MKKNPQRKTEECNIIISVSIVAFLFSFSLDSFFGIEYGNHMHNYNFVLLFMLSAMTLLQRATLLTSIKRNSKKFQASLGIKVIHTHTTHKRK